jgi:hypothetical protein
MYSGTMARATLWRRSSGCGATHDHEDIAFSLSGAEASSEVRSVCETVAYLTCCLPYQPIEKLSASLSAADLHVVVMGDQYVGIVTPAKSTTCSPPTGYSFTLDQPSHVRDIVRQTGSDIRLRARRCRRSRGQHLACDAMRNYCFAGDCRTGKRFSKELLIPQMICAIEQRDAIVLLTHALSKLKVRYSNAICPTEPEANN